MTDLVPVGPRLIAIGPDGARHTKNDNLEGYRAGFSVITELSQEDFEVLVTGTTGVTFSWAPSPERYGVKLMSSSLRYTWTWM